jgi:hypothetical protein
MQYENHNRNSVNQNMYKNNTVYRIKNKCLTRTGKSSPKINANGSDNEESTYNKNLKDKNYFYSNSRTIEDNPRDKIVYVKSNSRIKYMKDISVENTPKSKIILNNKRKSQNNLDLNNSKISNSIEMNNPEFNRTVYMKKSSANIYYKKSLKNKINDISTTENRTYKKEKIDTCSINSNQNSFNKKSIIRHKTNNDINRVKEKFANASINENTEYLFSIDSIKEKVVNNVYYFYKKMYSYLIIKPKPKVCYIEKFIKYKNENIKLTLNNSINNISRISESKNNNDFNSSNISFSNYKNKEKNKNNKDIPPEEVIFNEKNLISDYESEENFGLDEVTPNQNKNSNSKKNYDDEHYNDFITFELSDEKDKNKNMIDVNKYDYDKAENELIKKNIFTYIKAEQEVPIEKKKRKEKEKENNSIKSIKLKLDNSNKKELNNSFSNSNSKKSIKLRNKNNEIEKKISLATKKLNDILLKKK